MEGVTLVIALAASALVFFLSPVYGLIVYVAAFAWYPQYLSVQLGTLDFTVRRIVIIAVLLRLFLLTDLPGRFRLIWLDKLVLIYFAATILAGAMTTQYLTAFFVNRSGQFFDTILPYFAVRLIIRNRQQYLTLLKGILIIAAPLAIVGFYQCMTGNNPVGALMKYYAWSAKRQAVGYVPIARLGFFRADATFDHSIMFGLFFAMFGSVCAGLLRNVKKYKMFWWTGLGLMGLGIFSSMSAGPVLVALLATLFICVYRWRRRWRLMTAAVIVMCVCVEIISNRHFYEVIDRFTFSGRSAWYRSKLIEVGIFEGGMSGHWITGYGWGVDPGWSAKIDFRSHTDLGANQYLHILSAYGLVGLVSFLVINIGIVKRLVEAYKASSLDSDKWLIWCLSAGFFGLMAGFMSVSIFGQPTSIYYMMLGFAAMMPRLVIQANQMLPQSNTIGGNKQERC